ncbi:MAG: DUF2200 family protein [Caldilineaceae bacterium]
MGTMSRLTSHKLMTSGSKRGIMSKHRIYTTSVASVYPHYVTKAEKKGRTKTEVDEIIRWLTGYNQEKLEEQLNNETDFETFFMEAPNRPFTGNDHGQDLVGSALKRLKKRP